MMKILIANCHATIITREIILITPISNIKRRHVFILWVDNLKSNDEGNIKEIE